jgi:hypothetical protein
MQPAMASWAERDAVPGVEPGYLQETFAADVMSRKTPRCVAINTPAAVT